MEGNPKLSAKPTLLLLTGAFVTAFGPALVRLSQLEPTATAFWRLALAFPLLLWIALRSSGSSKRPSPLLNWPVFAFTAAAFALDLTCWHTSIRLTTVANASLFANFAPLIVALVSWRFFGERFGRGFWLGLGLALFGAGLLVWKGLQVDVVRLRGDALGFATAGFYAAYILGMSRLRGTHGVFLVMAVVSGGSAVFVWVLTLGLGDNLWPADPSGWWPLVVLALGPQALGQGCIVYALAFLPPAFGAVNLLFQPVVAAVIAWLILGEYLGPFELAGIVVVLFGIAIANRARHTPRSAAPAETQAG